jgi:NADPH:quinone reductase-like Zn-dependent oxidoreductase
VIATARGAAKAAQARGVGAELGIDTTTPAWAADVKSAGGADVVLDMVGVDFFPANVELLKPDGRLVVIATMSGHKVEVDLRVMMMKRLTLTASTLRARDAEEKARLARAVETHVWPWLEAGACALSSTVRLSSSKPARHTSGSSTARSLARPYWSPKCDSRTFFTPSGSGAAPPVVSAALPRRRRRAPGR